MILLGLCAQHLSSLIMYHSRIPGGSVILALHFQVKKTPAFWLKKIIIEQLVPVPFLRGHATPPSYSFSPIGLTFILTTCGSSTSIPLSDSIPNRTSGANHPLLVLCLP